MSTGFSNDTMLLFYRYFHFGLYIIVLSTINTFEKFAITMQKLTPEYTF